jgi:hypothetical protein
MDDQDAKERADGIDWPWMWRGDEHWFFEDRGVSGGMVEAKKRCARDGISKRDLSLEMCSPNLWAAYQRGGWPPATEGFQVA